MLATYGGSDKMIELAPSLNANIEVNAGVVTVEATASKASISPISRLTLTDSTPAPSIPSAMILTSETSIRKMFRLFRMSVLITNAASVKSMCESARYRCVGFDGLLNAS